MISILIPFRNEIDSILYYNRTLFPIIDEIMHSFEQEYEYVFVDDGSTDNSSDAVYTMIVASNIKSGKNLKEVDLTRNKFGNGLGNALRYGFTRCKGDYIIVMDADLSYKPIDVTRMLLELKLHPKVKCISASPYFYGRNSKIVGSSPMRIFGSIAFNSIYSFLLGRKITCATGMFRLYYRETLSKFRLKSVGYDINSELITEFLLGGEEFVEIPSVLHVRTIGVSKMNVITEVIREFKLISKIIYKIIFSNHKP